MQATIPFGESTLEAELPERTTLIPNVALKSLAPVDDLAAHVREALASPLGSPRVGELVGPGARVVIAFDDATVSSFGPVRGVVIQELLSELESAGVARESVTLICANALHRKFRPEELACMIGEDLVCEFGDRLFSHDAEDADALTYLGETENGYDVEVSRHSTEADLTIYVNAGYNRGFSGGWKSVCVGLSTYRSIRHHHTPDGMSMSIKNNRMHAMLDEMGRHLEANIPGKIFKVDTVLANSHEVARIVAGTVWETRREVLETMAGLFPARRGLSSEKFDALIYGVPDSSPYSIFSKMNPLLTLISSGLGYLGGTVQALGKPGCSVVMVTPCPNDWDRVHHASYPDVWENVLGKTRDAYEIFHTHADAYATHAELIKKYREEFAFHPVHAILASYPLKRLSHIGKVIVAGAQDPSVAEHLGFTAVGSVDEALAALEEEHGKDFSLAYVDQPPVPSKFIL